MEWAHMTMETQEVTLPATDKLGPMKASAAGQPES